MEERGGEKGKKQSPVSPVGPTIIYQAGGYLD